MLFLLLIFCGIIGGIIAGLFGLGGGIIFTPILFVVFSASDITDPAVWSIATSLFCTFTASISSSVQQRSKRNFYWKEGFIIGLIGSIGVYFGKSLVTSQYYTETVFVAVFSMLLIVVAIVFFKKSKHHDSSKEQLDVLSVKGAGISGSLGGFVAALAGVGGGVVLVPLMSLVYKIRMSKAVSVSSLAIVIISLSGWLQYAFTTSTQIGLTKFSLGFVDFGSGLPLIIGAIVGGIIGVRINHRLPQNIIQAGFGIVVVIIAILMISRLF